MNSFITHIPILLSACFMMACQYDGVSATPPASNVETDGRTLVVYYSYTNNCKEIVETLSAHISADVIRIEPVEKDLDYAADNYGIGTKQQGVHWLEKQGPYPPASVR